MIIDFNLFLHTMIHTYINIHIYTTHDILFNHDHAHFAQRGSCERSHVTLVLHRQAEPRAGHRGIPRVPLVLHRRCVRLLEAVLPSAQHSQGRPSEGSEHTAGAPRIPEAENCRGQGRHRLYGPDRPVPELNHDAHVDGVRAGTRRRGGAKCIGRDNF